jgi:PII-like signaling protein
MKNEKIYIEILKMIDREEKILRSLNVVKELIENDGDGSAVKYNLYKLMDIYEESQNW